MKVLVEMGTREVESLTTDARGRSLCESTGRIVVSLWEKQSVDDCEMHRNLA